MAINPNTDFSSGAILTAAQQNRFPRGVMALATSSTNYTLTTSIAIATGMSVTFTAVANRNYKITYVEPQVGTPGVSGGFTGLTIRLTSAAGSGLALGILQTNSATAYSASVVVQYVYSGAAGSTTIVGCANASSVTGTPVLGRSATGLASLLVEDIGPA